MNSICFYHNDSDGLCAGAIVKHFNLNCEMIKIQYGDKVDFNIMKGKTVYIVDFSFPDMNKINNLIILSGGELIWIDHHKSAKENNEEMWNSDIKGLRNFEYSGCFLTWLYFNNVTDVKNIKINVPVGVELINDYDLWKNSFGQYTKYFNEYVSNKIESSDDDFWKEIFKNNDFVLSEAFKIGGIIHNVKMKRVKEIFTYGHDEKINGMKCRVMNSYCDISESGNYAIDQGYDVGIIWRWINERIVVSLRSKPDIDISILAKKFKGGGHKNASAFTIEKKLKLMKLIGDKNEANRLDG